MSQGEFEPELQRLRNVIVAQHEQITLLEKSLAAVGQHLLALEHITKAAWAKILLEESDALATLARIERGNLAGMERAYEEPEGSTSGDGLHVAIQTILHHGEQFWASLRTAIENAKKPSD